MQTRQTPALCANGCNASDREQCPEPAENFTFEELSIFLRTIFIHPSSLLLSTYPFENVAIGFTQISMLMSWGGGIKFGMLTNSPPLSSPPSAPQKSAEETQTRPGNTHPEEGEALFPLCPPQCLWFEFLPDFCWES